MKKSILIVFIFQTLFGYSCTTFVIKNKNDLVFGRNLDWVSDNGLVVVNQRNQLKRSIVFPPNRPVTWSSKYGSITFNQFGKEFPYGGINEKGLVIEIMRAKAEYPMIDSRPALNELQWIQYQLDNAATIEEVIANDKLIRLSKINQELHFLIADKKGNTAVIEFFKGKMVVYKDDQLLIPVLENDSYKTSLLKYKKKVNTRFTRAATKVESYSENNSISAVDYSFNILNDVALDGSWSIVYDIKNSSIHFITKSKKKRKTIHINEFDFTCNKSNLVFDLQSEKKGPINNYFFELNYKLNKKKMVDAMRTNRILFPSRIKNMFYDYYYSIKCN